MGMPQYAQAMNYISVHAMVLAGFQDIIRREEFSPFQSPHVILRCRCIITKSASSNQHNLSTMSTNDSSTTHTNCAACGKEGGNHNTCNKCKMVRYCNAACKKKHCSKHKKACKKRVAELHEEAIFKEHPPNDECPICLLPLPLNAGHSAFESCCGKVICNGCVVAMKEEALGRGKIVLCAFCRAPRANSDEEEVKRLKKLMEADNADAFEMLAGMYANGDGVPQDRSKANELYLRAGELGCAGAYHNLGVAYDNGRGVEVDKKKAKHFYELAAMKGSVNARHNLGIHEYNAGNHHRAFKHFILSARAGYKKSLDTVKVGYTEDMVTKDEYANALRAYQQRHDEMKSDGRDKVEALIEERKAARGRR